MVRSIWRRTVLGVLASTGLAWGQQAAVPSTPPGDTVGRIITVTEMGKPGQKCKVLREWKMADGSIARQVVDLNTGEKMTIVEAGVLSGPVGGQPGGNIKSIASRIFHWGRSETAPVGTPMPPADTDVPVMAATPSAPEKKKPEVDPTPAPRTAKATVPGSTYSPSRSSSGNEKRTVVVPNPANPLIVNGNEQTPPTFKVARPVWNQAATSPTVTNEPPAAVAKAPVPPVQPAQPSDWRKSWGKLPEQAKADESTRKNETAKQDAQPKPKIDPLTDSLPHTKVAVEQKMSEKMTVSKLPEEKPTRVVKVLPDALSPLPPLEKTEPLPPLPPLPSTNRVESTPATPAVAPAAPVVTLPAPVVAPVVTAPTAPVVTPPAPVTSRPSLRHDKVVASGMPAPEPIGRVMIHNDADPGMLQSQANTQHLLHVLRDSIYPSQREWAADQLADCDWKLNTPVVDAMVTSAKEDPAATVRAGCVRCLGRMHVNTVPVVMAVQSLKADADPRVRTEVQEALATLAPGLPMQADPAPEAVKGE